MTAGLVVADNRPKGKKGVSWRPAWRFKGATTEHLEPILAGAPGPIVHACCGPSRIPHESVRVDFEHPSADLNIDVCELDAHLSAVGTVFMDPPYAWDLPTRQKAASAAWRALKPGGWLITHAPWVPRMPGGTLLRLDVREDGGFNWPLPPICLSVWKKPDLEIRSRSAERTRRRKDPIEQPNGNLEVARDG